MHLKRRLSCQDTGIPQWTQSFIGWRCSVFLNMSTSSVKLLIFFNNSRISRKTEPHVFCHSFRSYRLPSKPSSRVTPLPPSTLCRRKKLDQYHVKLSVSASKFTCHSGAICWITNTLEDWDLDDRTLDWHKLIPEFIFLSAARSDWL